MFELKFNALFYEEKGINPMKRNAWQSVMFYGITNENGKENYNICSRQRYGIGDTFVII